MKILVVGDSCIDQYVYGECERLCPEGPVPILAEQDRTEAPGMAGNTHRNMLAFCPDAELMSNNYLEIIKTRFVDSKTNQLLLRVDINDTAQRISKEDIEEICEQNYDLLVVSDYCKGFLQDSDLIKITCNCKLAVLDTKRKLTTEMLDAYDFVKVNEIEYERNKDIIESLADNSKIIITLGGKGVKFMDNIFPPPAVLQTFDVSGAGDVFTASFAYKLCSQEPVDESIRFAQECCNKVIQKKGTCIYEKDMD